jgi:hypothetical protein
VDRLLRAGGHAPFHSMDSTARVNADSVPMIYFGGVALKDPR